MDEVVRDVFAVEPNDIIPLLATALLSSDEELEVETPPAKKPRREKNTDAKTKPVELLHQCIDLSLNLR